MNMVYRAISAHRNLVDQVIRLVVPELNHKRSISCITDILADDLRPSCLSTTSQSTNIRSRISNSGKCKDNQGLIYGGT
jgi:hypothetical protein